MWYVNIFRQASVSSKNTVGNIRSKKSVKQKIAKQKAVNTGTQKFAKIITAHNACKYGEHCVYQHKTTKAGNEIIEIMINMNSLENTVTLLSEKIIKNPNKSNHCDLTFRKDN